MKGRLGFWGDDAEAAHYNNTSGEEKRGGVRERDASRVLDTEEVVVVVVVVVDVTDA